MTSFRPVSPATPVAKESPRRETATGNGTLESTAGTEALPALVAPDPRRRRPRWWAELAVVVWLLWIYDIITNLPAFREKAAFAHGFDVLHMEALLHVNFELTLNHWLYGHPLLGLVVGDYYDNSHFIVTFGVIGWLYWRHPDAYRPLRNTLVLINIIGFLVFWLYPMAPPRLLPGAGFYDIVALTHAFGGWHTGILSKAANQFAAMPSLHMAWAVWSALAVWSVLRARRWAKLVWIYPVLTFFAVLATANHLITDCVAGVATVAVARWLGYRLEDRFWRWRLDHFPSREDGAVAERASYLAVRPTEG